MAIRSFLGFLLARSFLLLGFLAVVVAVTPPLIQQQPMGDAAAVFIGWLLQVIAGWLWRNPQAEQKWTTLCTATNLILSYLNIFSAKIRG